MEFEVDVMYYEAHITIEPVEGARFDEFESICAKFKFKPAELLLRKSRLITPERSRDDSFATGHGKHFPEIKARAGNLSMYLKASGFKVWRLKIEACVFDEKYDKLFSINEVENPVNCGKIVRNDERNNSLGN